MRLFKRQKTSGDIAKLFFNLNSVHHNQQKSPIPILASDQKFIFVNQCNQGHFVNTILPHMLTSGQAIKTYGSKNFT